MSQELTILLPRGHRALQSSPPPYAGPWRTSPRGGRVFASVLDGALRAFVQDAILAVLEVHSVRPEPGAEALRVAVQPCRAGVYFDQHEALARLRRAGPCLRAALAAAVHADAAPELLFEVRSWREE